MDLGIHSWNQKNRQAPIPDRYWQLMRLLLPGVQAAKGFSYYSIPVWQQIVNILHPQRVVIRLNHEDDLVQLVALYRSNTLAGRIVYVEIFNEPNHPIEDFAGLADFRSRYLAADAYVRNLCPGWLICFPGLSPGFDMFGWLEKCKDLVAPADALGWHSYYNQSGNPLMQGVLLLRGQSAFPSKRLMVTEYCYTGGESGAPRPGRELAPEYAEAMHWFAAHGVAAVFSFLLESDDLHWHDVGEIFDEDLARALGALVISSGDNDSNSGSNGGSMALKDQFPQQFAEWETAGGVDNNFRKHLLGIGALQPTKADLLMLADEVKASAQQMQGALANYPF